MDNNALSNPVLPEDVSLLRDSIRESRPQINLADWQRNYSASCLQTAAAILEDTIDQRSPSPQAIRCALHSIEGALSVLLNEQDLSHGVR